MWKRITAWSAAFIVLAMMVAGAVAPTAVVSASVVIAAPPDRVWAVLTDLQDYPQWNQEMRLSGKLLAGRVIENVENPGPDQIVFWPTLLEVVPSRDLLWRGHLPLAGRFWLPRLLDAEHGFELRPVAGGTLFTQSETLRGVALWLWDAKQLLPAFRAMNMALKARAES